MVSSLRAPDSDPGRHQRPHSPEANTEKQKGASRPCRLPAVIPVIVGARIGLDSGDPFEEEITFALGDVAALVAFPAPAS